MGVPHLILSCLIYVVAVQSQAPEIQITKCCPENQIFDINSKDRCVEALESTQLLTNAIVKSSDESFIIADLNISKSYLHPCYGANAYEVFKLKNSIEVNDILDSFLTSTGSLKVSKYGPGESFTQDKFCIDRNEKKEMIAVMCDLCTQGFTCVQFCCPWGYSYQVNPDYYDDDYNPVEGESLEVCTKDDDLDLHYDKIKILDQRNKGIFNWNENKNVKFVGPKPEDLESLKGEVWNCPKGSKISGDEVTIPVAAEDLQYQIQVTIDGGLKDANVTDKALYWSKNEFCVVFRKYVEFDPEFDKIDRTIYDGDPTYLRCTDGDGDNSWCQAYEDYLYPIVLSISVIFLILTLLVYIAEDSLRKQKLFSHIIMSYLTTLIITYIFRLVELNKGEEQQGKLECKIKGYLTQYFSLAMFFWVNVSSFNIWSKLTQGHSGLSMSEQKKYIRFAIYAQGMPLLICLLTLLVDEFGDNVAYLNKPNMGEYGCFLGFPFKADRPSFFETSYFLYFFLFVTLLIMANAGFLIHTMKILRDGFKNKEENIKNQGKEETAQEIRQRLWDQFMTVARVSILMGALWFCELISAALHVEYDKDDICIVQFILDAPNICIGFLVFLFTVVKKPVYMGLKNKVVRFTSGAEVSTNSTSQAPPSSSNFSSA